MTMTKTPHFFISVWLFSYCLRETPLEQFENYMRFVN